MTELHSTNNNAKNPNTPNGKLFHVTLENTQHSDLQEVLIHYRQFFHRGLLWRQVTFRSRNILEDQALDSHTASNSVHHRSNSADASHRAPHPLTTARYRHTRHGQSASSGLTNTHRNQSAALNTKHISTTQTTTNEATRRTATGRSISIRKIKCTV